jgi:hypothetical protein
MLQPDIRPSPSKFLYDRVWWLPSRLKLYAMRIYARVHGIPFRTPTPGIPIAAFLSHMRWAWNHSLKIKIPAVVSYLVSNVAQDKRFCRGYYVSYYVRHYLSPSLTSVKTLTARNTTKTIQKMLMIVAPFAFPPVPAQSKRRPSP